MSVLKLCLNCRWMSQRTPESDSIFWNCLHPTTSTVNVVSGEVHYSSCYNNRDSDEPCGQSGSLWEPRP